MSDCVPFGCKEAFSRLDDFLDRELTHEEMLLVKMHLDKCHMCAQEFQFEASVLVALKEKLHHIDLPEDLLQQLSSALDKA